MTNNNNKDNNKRKKRKEKRKEKKTKPDQLQFDMFEQYVKRFLQILAIKK